MRLQTRAKLAALLGSSALLGGCASSWHPPASSSLARPAQGSKSEFVFAPPARSDPEAYDDPYFARRDAALGVPSGTTSLQAIAYPGPPPPDLYEQRWISIRRSADQFIYFDRYPTYSDWDSPSRCAPIPYPRPYPRHHRGW